MEKIALVTLIDSEYKPYIWNHIEYAIMSYFYIHQNYEVIACGGGVERPPSNTSYDHIVWSDKQINGEDIYNYIPMLPEVFDIAEQTDCSKMLITPALWWVEDESMLDKKLAVVSDHEVMHNELDAKIMYGKTKTLKNILLNRTCNPLISSGRNMFKNLVNVVGLDNVRDFTYLPTYFKTKKRSVLSRDFWGDENC